MDLRNPEFIDNNLEEKKIKLRELCLRYFQNYFIEDIETETRMKILDQVEVLRDSLPVEEANSVVTEAKKQGLNIPESMFLSEKAYFLVKNSWRKYQFYNNKLFNFPDIIKRRLLDSNLHSDELNEETMVAIKDGVVVGYTRYVVRKGLNGKEMGIIYQWARPENPGIGLGMLNELIPIAKKLGCSCIYLTTDRLPKGLGNLGFEFDEERNHLLTMVVYNLDLETQ